MSLSLRMRFCREERLEMEGEMEPERPWLGRLMVTTFPVAGLHEIPSHGWEEEEEEEEEAAEQGSFPIHEEERSAG
jgi:hypothetical protein